MNPKHNAKTRLSHYENALDVVINQYPTGIFHVCLILCLWSNEGKPINIDVDYPEFWLQKPISAGFSCSWFSNNDARIKAVKRAIELVKEKISRNEMD